MLVSCSGGSPAPHASPTVTVTTSQTVTVTPTPPAPSLADQGSPSIAVKVNGYPYAFSWTEIKSRRDLAAPADTRVVTIYIAAVNQSRHRVPDLYLAGQGFGVFVWAPRQVDADHCSKDGAAPGFCFEPRICIPEYDDGDQRTLPPRGAVEIACTLRHNIVAPIDPANFEIGYSTSANLSVPVEPAQATLPPPSD